MLLYKLLSTLGINSRSILLFLSGEIHLSGRDRLYGLVIDAIINDPLSGIGVAGDRRIIGGSYAHNFFIEVLGNFGVIIGLVFSIAFLLLIIRSLATKDKSKYSMIAIWLCYGFVHLMVSSSYLEDIKFWIFAGILFSYNRSNKLYFLKCNKNQSECESMAEKNIEHSETPLVSICCITYNHEKYIADALESFLKQETSFPFEIIIHDDASTDNTPKIVEEYQKRYPKIIRTILQKDNQYSKGKKPLRDFVTPLVRGKYMATCEGDDFWTDNKKLQIQVNFLENNPDYIMCFHKVKVVDVNKRFLGKYYGLANKGSKEIDIKEAATSGVVHVSSRLFRTEFYRKPKPEWMNYARHGDYALALYSAAEGKVYYMDKVMSAYRMGVEGSIMTNFRKNYSKQNEINYHLNRIDTLRRADEYYQYKYHDEIEKVNLVSYVIIGLLKNDFSALAMVNYNNFIKFNGLKRFIKLLILKKIPQLSKVLLKIKRSITVEKNR